MELKDSSQYLKCDFIFTVVPAQAGILAEQAARISTLCIGSRLRGNDGEKDDGCH
jgi:hypothetical protein